MTANIQADQCKDGVHTSQVGTNICVYCGADTSPVQADTQEAFKSEETSGFICDVGYSTEHYFNTVSDCPICKKQGYMIVEAGWIASRWLHANKVCRGYYEVDDGGIAWQRQVTPEVYDLIVKARDKALERDRKAEEATGRKCRTCGTTRGISYYGMWPDPLKCFCKRHHIQYINSAEWAEEHGVVVTDLASTHLEADDLPSKSAHPPHNNTKKGNT